MIQFSAPYSKVGMTQDSTISLAERGLEYPRKQPENCFLALLMLCSMPGFADSVLDHRKPRQLAWGSVGTSRLGAVGNFDNFCLCPIKAKAILG